VEVCKIRKGVTFFTHPVYCKPLKRDFSYTCAAAVDKILTDTCGASRGSSATYKPFLNISCIPCHLSGRASTKDIYHI